MLSIHHFLAICLTNVFSGFSFPHPAMTDTIMPNSMKDLNVGTSPGYLKAAYYLLSSMNQTVNPCDDFFEYACGRWISEHPIPSDLATYEVYASVREKVERKMKELYDSKQSTNSKALGAVKTIYHACMDTDRIRSMQGKEIVEAIEYLGAWPIVYGQKWSEEKFNFTQIMIRIAQTRFTSIFMNIYVSSDQKDVSRRLIHIDQGRLTLGFGAREYYLNAKNYAPQLEAYKEYIIDKAMLVSHDVEISKKRTEIENEANDIIDFEKKLAQIMVPEENRRNYTLLYHQYRLSDLTTFMSEMDWNKYFRTVVPTDLHWYLNKDPIINIIDVEFLKQLDALIKVTPKRTLANYMIWLYTSTWNFQLDERYDDIHQKFLRTIIGKQMKSSRWKICSEIAVERMGYASGALYVNSFFNEADKQAALEMVNHLKDAFKEMLGEYNWLHESTRQKALKKINEMLSLIGYPEFIRNTKNLDEYYKLLHIYPNDTFAQTITKTSRWSVERSYRKLVKPVKRTEFGASASVVNAFYSSFRNAIVFPAAILQAPFFDRTFPKAMNFGGIGSVIGHEIIHGFDDQGSQFDYQGNLRDWWDSATKRNFNEKKDCFIKKYNNYVVPETNLHISGLRTLDENIADNGGVKEAFRAYRNHIKKIGHEEKRLPGLEHLDMNQIFFLSSAQMWCGHSRPAALIRQILTGQHAPLRFRVNGVVVNQPEFAEVFKCPPNSPMNPMSKCLLW
ncbi:Peptidase M13 family protein [Acanthocheilonema viteae]